MLKLPINLMFLFLILVAFGCRNNTLHDRLATAIASECNEETDQKHEYSCRRGVIMNVLVTNSNAADLDECVYAYKLENKDGQLRSLDRSGEFFEAVVLALIKKKDVVRLARLLSLECAETIGQIPLEFELAIADQEDQLGDSIGILIAAARMSTGNARECLTLSIRRSIGPYIDDDANDVRWLENCDNWWKVNRSRCVLNLEYPQGYSLYDGQSSSSLFNLK